MDEQMGTPGSNADTSVNGSKIGAPKDKACPFCHQQFTSSSLGRHLDLYIKEKNPKPQDGVHDVDEIRKMRGGITRRQPRNSTARREGSTPGGTPGAQDRRSPGPDSVNGNTSPSLRRDENTPMDRGNYLRRPGVIVNKGTWETTGVMNVIPPVRNGDSPWDSDEREIGRKLESRSRSVSRQMLHKSTFEQKQKMMEALDNAKASELALRELLGSIRAAKQRIEGLSVFDYDPLTLDFPALCLHCLPPPPTLQQSSPVPNPSSWSISPPDDQQYEALREHFSTEIQRWRVSCAIVNTAPTDDLSYPPPPDHMFAGAEDPSETAKRAEESAVELESRIFNHLQLVYTHWNSLTSQKRQEIWILEFARNIGKKSNEIQKLKKEKELSSQEKSHLKQQVDELSRLQQPREFRLVSPTTVGISGEMMSELGKVGLATKGVGFDLMDRHVHLDVAVERAIGRWRGIVRDARGGGQSGGMVSQRSLSGESAPPTSTPVPTTTVQQPPASSNHQTILPSPTPEVHNQNQENHNHTQETSPNQPPNNDSENNNAPPVQLNGGDSMGSDADADADMEDDDSFVEMTDIPRTNEAPPTTNFRLTNGNNSQQQGGGGRASGHMEGLENQPVLGYVSIGA